MNGDSQPRIFERVLVTGGCGFIGSNLVRWLRSERPSWSIVNLDLLTYAGNRANLADIEGDPHYTFIHGDIRDAAVVEQAMTDCDGVLHLAAESHVDRSIADAAPFLTTNVLGAQVLLETARRLEVPRFVQVSTDEVYGDLPLDQPDLLFTEDSPMRPRSPYAASKAAGDHLAMAAHHTFGLPVSVTRCGNNLGPFQFPEKVIPLFVTNLIDGLKVPLYGDGRNVRDWIHVEDHCSAIVAVLERGEAGEVYNIGARNEISNVELTHAILEAMGCGEEMIEPVADRLGHDRRYAIDPSKITRELDWRPSRSAWPRMLEETVAWYRDNEAWWRGLKQGAKKDAATK